MSYPALSESLAALHACLPPMCSLQLTEEVPGGHLGGLASVAPELKDALLSLTPDCNTMILDGCTTCGKSKVFPSVAASLGLTLAATTVRVDVEDIAAKATVPTYWQVGGNVSGGAPKTSSRLHVVTVGLLARWVAQDPSVLEKYETVILDEYDAAKKNASYATLIARVRTIARRCVLMSATHTAATTAMVEKNEAILFEFRKREHALLKFDMSCPAGVEQSSLTALAAALRNKGFSSLMFLPGEKEVSEACKAIGHAAYPLHAKAEEKEKRAAFLPQASARVVCSTTGAERGATIPDMTFSLDLSVSRKEIIRVGVAEMQDTLADEATAHQRASRAGRTHPGIAVRIQARKNMAGEHSDLDDVMDAIVLGMTPALYREETFMAEDVQEHVWAEAVSNLRLFPNREAATEAFCGAPVPLSEGLAVTKAAQWGVQSEVAWVAMLLRSGAVRKDVSFGVAMDALRKNIPAGEEADHFHVRKLAALRDAHGAFERRGNLARSTMSGGYLEQAAAASFAALQTSVCRVRGGQGFCAGQVFASSMPDGHCIALGLRKVLGKGVVPTMELGVTPWVVQQLDHALPTSTAVYSTDSTVMSFRADVNAALRRKGIDLVDWREQSGGWEADVAAQLSHCRVADYALIFPNGNRTAKQERVDEVAWMPATARGIARSLARFSKGAAFIGKPEMSPGIKHPVAFAALTPTLQKQVKEAGVPLVEEASVGLSDDGIHWNVMAGREVQRLVEEMVTNARKVEADALSWWHYVRNDANGIHYATCRACNKALCAAHVESSKHKTLCGETGLPTAPLERVLLPSVSRCLEPEEVPVPAPPAAAPPAAAFLPPGWKSACAPCGAVYFYHEITRVSTWHLPQEQDA